MDHNNSWPETSDIFSEMLKIYSLWKLFNKDPKIACASHENFVEREVVE